MQIHLVMHPHEIAFVVTEGGFYSYYIHQGNKSDKERNIVRKKYWFMHTKRFNTLFKKSGCNSTSTNYVMACEKNRKMIFKICFMSVLI